MNSKAGGFALIEMTVGILCASVVTLAAMTLLLTGVRTEKHVSDTASRRQTARTVISMVENLAGSGDINVVEELDGGGDGSWLLSDGENSHVLLRYNAGERELLTGGVVLMSDVENAKACVTRDGQEPLLEFSLTSGGVAYKTGVCCRAGMDINNLVAAAGDSQAGVPEIVKAAKTDIEEKELSEAEENGRYRLLITLCTQAGSTGRILNSESDQGKNYSEWYIGEYENDSEWNEKTPWCGCFVSWAISKEKNNLTGYAKAPPFRFADVNEGKGAFEAEDKPGVWKDSDPVPADLIFFDRDFNGTADHVGVVLCVTEESVYTVEGNCGGEVRLQSYAPGDCRILGYGALPWKTDDSAASP